MAIGALALVAGFALWKVFAGSGVRSSRSSTKASVPSRDGALAYEPQSLPDWVDTLSPGMSPDQFATAIGKEGVTGSAAAEIRSYVWDTKDVALKAFFRDGLALVIEMTVTSGSRPPVQARSLLEIQPGLTVEAVEEAGGNPVLLRSRRLSTGPSGPYREEVREWKIFDGTLDAGATLSVTFLNGPASRVTHPWAARGR